MPPIQTTYNEEMRAGVPGQVPDMQQASFVSRTVEEAAGIAFGVPVSQGANDKGVADYTAGDFVGITVRERSLPAEQDALAENDSAMIIRKGPVFVLANVGVDAGNPVYITAAGAFTDVEGTNFLIPGARWDTTTSGAGQLAVVWLG